MDKVQLAGQVKDEKGVIMTHIKVQLLKKIEDKRQIGYRLAHTTYTDEMGYYTFEVNGKEEGVYQIVAIGMREDCDV